MHDETEVNGTVVKSVAFCTMKMNNSLFKHAFEISTFVFFVMPMTLITVLYLLIGYKLRRNRLVKRPSLCGNAPDRQTLRGQKHVINMLGE
jgi:hypothetical protein